MLRPDLQQIASNHNPKTKALKTKQSNLDNDNMQEENTTIIPSYSAALA